MTTFVVTRRDDLAETVDAEVMFVDRHGFLCFAEYLPNTDAPMSLTHTFTDWTSAKPLRSKQSTKAA